MLLDLETIRYLGRKIRTTIRATPPTQYSWSWRARLRRPKQRLRSVIARERQMPKMLAAARANLKNPPKIYTEVAIEQMPGMIGFFQKDVPSAFTAVKDQALLNQFHQANAAVIGELQAMKSS